MTILNFPKPAGDDETEDAEPDSGGLSQEGYSPLGEARSIWPWESLEQLWDEIRYHGGRYQHASAYHGVRSGPYLLKTLWYALRGVKVLGGKLARYQHVPELWVVESQSVARGGRDGGADAMKAHTERKKTQSERRKIILLVLAAAAILLLVLSKVMPWWGWAGLGVVTVLILAHHGKPAGRTIMESATVPSPYERLTNDMVVEALGSLSLSGINQVLRVGDDIVFVAPGCHRDGPGWRVALDLPKGVTATDVIERRDKLASGLRRPVGCVWPEGDESEHAGRLVLYVCDYPLAKMRQPAWPLASGAPFSLFRPVPFGSDQRGRRISIPLMFANLLIGSIPRMGKTRAMRNVLLAAALDPLAELHVWELKGTGDLKMLGEIAHAYGSGADEDTIADTLADLRKVHADLDRRAAVIKGLPTDVCPESKVTPELAAKRSLRLHPLVIAVDECQEMFGHPQFGKEAGKLAETIIRRGPALGIIIILATQRPDKDSLPTGVTANVAMRFCLRVMDQVTNDMILGTSAYKRGINAALLGLSEKGVGQSVGFSDEVHSQIVKAYDIERPQAEQICKKARAARLARGLLTGHAAGAEDDADARDFLDDVLTVFDADDKLWCSTIAARLRSRMADVYASITQTAVSDQLRFRDVEVKNVRESGDVPRKGCERAAVEAAMDGPGGHGA